MLTSRTRFFSVDMGFELGPEHSAPPTFGLHSVTSLFVSEKRGAKSSLFWTRTYNFWGNACMKGENDFVTIWTNPTEPVLKLCFTLFEATSSTILCIGLSFTSQNYQNWEPELYLFRLCDVCVLHNSSTQMWPELPSIRRSDGKKPWGKNSLKFWKNLRFQKKLRFRPSQNFPQVQSVQTSK